MAIKGLKSIGILGGTFNPVHQGHLVLAQSAYEMCDLASVMFIPCAKPPHKEITGLAPAKHRWAMLESALEGDPRFELSDQELKRGGRSYTIDTLRDLKARYPRIDLTFIIGSDTLPELHLWKDIYDVLKLCSFAVFARPGSRTPDDFEARLKLDPPWPERIRKGLHSGYLFEVSSSDIRHRVAEGMSIRYLVPPEVEMYIAERGLYTH